MTKNESSEESDLNKEYAILLSKLNNSNENQTMDFRKKLMNIHNESNNLFKKIKKPSSLKLDYRLLTETSFLSSKNLEKIIDDNQTNLETFIGLIINNNLEEYITEAKKCFFGVNFYKTLDLETKVKKEKQIFDRIIEDKEDVKLVFENKEIDKMEIPNKIKQILEERGDVEYYKLVIDVDSYSKTIENIFYLAFIIKQKMASLVYIKDVLYVTSNYIESNANNHIILELEYKDYERIKEYLQLENSFIT